MTTLLLMAGAAIATAIYFIMSHRRPTADFRVRDVELPDIEAGLPLIAGITNGDIHWRNTVQVIENEDIFEAMFADIRAAEHSVHLETFVWTSGELTQRLVEILRVKVEQGVAVRVLLDAIGAMSSRTDEFDLMRDYGIEVAEYRPIKRLDVRRFNNRTHRKILVIDGRLGYTFGHGFGDEWLGQAQDKHHWRDTGVRLQGSVVRALQSVFLQDWIEASGLIPTDPGYFPRFQDDDPEFRKGRDLRDQGAVEQHEGSTPVHVVTSTADSQSSVAQLYQLAMQSARSEVIIQNPYFSPDPQVSELMATIARRGVAVHLMVPGKHTDAPVVQRAGRRLYRAMLEAGVRIYEYETTLLHQKIVIVDDKWSHIGSTNFDERSLALNAEIGVGILDKRVAAELKQAFQNDMQVSTELTLDEWKQRPWYQRLIDWSAYQIHGQI